jgi:hypothetical protein
MVKMDMAKRAEKVESLLAACLIQRSVNAPSLDNALAVVIRFAMANNVKFLLSMHERLHLLIHNARNH